MSEYVDIKIENLSMYSFRNYLESDIFGLFFSKHDLCTLPNCIVDPEDEDSTSHTRYFFKTSVKKLKKDWMLSVLR